jgi:uncharacterized Zn finger protein (UPF0148 family)
MPKKIKVNAINEHCPKCGTFLFEYVKDGITKIVRCITCDHKEVKGSENNE